MNDRATSCIINFVSPSLHIGADPTFPGFRKGAVGEDHQPLILIRLHVYKTNMFMTALHGSEQELGEGGGQVDMGLTKMTL